MHIILATIYLKPEWKQAYLKDIIEQTKASLAHEPGLLRFDIVEDSADVNTMHIYEIFKDKAAHTHHVAADYHTSFMAQSKDWHAKPPVVRVCKDLFLGQPPKR